MKIPSTVGPIAFCCAFSQSMIREVQRSRSLWAHSGFSTRSNMKSVVLRTNPAVHMGPRDVTSGRISPVSRMRCRCMRIRCSVIPMNASASTS